MTDPHFRPVIEAIRQEKNFQNPQYPQYILGDNGLLYFEDWEGNDRICVPSNLRSRVMKEDHETITEGAHCGYHKAFNRLASNYFWPRMSKDIKEFVTSCDICQKSKVKRHAPYGMLRPIPIPSQPFEVITMDFIPELPTTKSGHDNVLVIVDKLTKFAIFVPTVTTIKEQECAKLVFDNVFTKYGLPRQIITDRDTKWTGSFWEETCKLFDIKRALTTSYHPQADGQTEIMNQLLETALRIYVNPQRDNWDEFLSSFALSYNSTPHSATGFSPATLLLGYQPKTGATQLRHSDPAITLKTVDRSRIISGLELDNSAKSVLQADTPRSSDVPDKPIRGATRLDNADHNLSFNSLNEEALADSAASNPRSSIDQAAVDVFEAFKALRTQAKDAIVFAQTSARRNYNKGRLTFEFEVGDFVLLNPHSLRLLQNESGIGKKLLKKYDGPFEITEKYSPVTYRLRLPSSYRIHPIINIAHLEPYHSSPTSFGPRSTIPFNRIENAAQEWEVEKIVGERRQKRGSKRIPYYKVRYKGFGPEHDLWIPKSYLKNAPEVLRTWIKGSTLSN